MRMEIVIDVFINPMDAAISGYIGPFVRLCKTQDIRVLETEGQVSI